MGVLFSVPGSESESSYDSSGSSSPEHEVEPEVEAGSESEVEEDPYVKFLDMGGSQYTDEDPIYVEELTKVCPPAPLFVLRWNRANNPRSFHNRTNNTNNRNWEQQARPRHGNYGGHDHRQERSK